MAFKKKNPVIKDMMNSTKEELEAKYTKEEYIKPTTKKEKTKEEKEKEESRSKAKVAYTDTILDEGRQEWENRNKPGHAIALGMGPVNPEREVTVTDASGNTKTTTAAQAGFQQKQNNLLGLIKTNSEDRREAQKNGATAEELAVYDERATEYTNQYKSLSPRDYNKNKGYIDEQIKMGDDDYATGVETTRSFYHNVDSFGKESGGNKARQSAFADLESMATKAPKFFKENGVGLITMYAGMLSEDEIEKESAKLSNIMYDSIWTPELQAEYEAVSSIVNNANQKRSSSMNLGNVDQKGVRANVTYGYTYTPEEEAAIKRKAELEMIRSEAESKKAETDYYVTREWELAKYKDKYGKAWYDGEGELPDNKTISEIVKDVIKRNYEELSNLDAYNYGESTSAVATNYTNDELYKKAEKGECDINDLQKAVGRISPTAKLTNTDLVRLGIMYNAGDNSWESYYLGILKPRFNFGAEEAVAKWYNNIVENGSFLDKVGAGVGGFMASYALSLPSAGESIGSAIVSNIEKSELPTYKTHLGYGQLSSVKSGVDKGRAEIGTAQNADVLEFLGMDRKNAEAWGSGIYGLTNSIAENLARSPLGVFGGAAMMFAQSFATEYKSGVDAYSDPTKNAIMSTVTAFSEGLTEKIELGALNKALDMTRFNPNHFKRMVKAARLSGSNEVLGELTNDAVRYISDYALNGEESELYQQARKLVVDGKAVDVGSGMMQILIKNGLNTAVVSYISGMALGGARGLFNYAGISEADVRRDGEKLIAGGININELVRLGKESTNPETKKIALEIEKAVASGEGLDGFDVQMLFSGILNDSADEKIDVGETESIDVKVPMQSEEGAEQNGDMESTINEAILDANNEVKEANTTEVVKRSNEVDIIRRYKNKLVKSKGVHIDNDFGYDLYAAENNIDGKKTFSIVEKSSGLEFGSGNTIEEAVTNATTKIESVGKEKIDQVIRDQKIGGSVKTNTTSVAKAVKGDTLAVGKAVSEADYTNEVIKKAKESNNKALQQAAQKYSDYDFKNEEQRYRAIGNMAKKLGITAESLVRSRAKSLFRRFATSISGGGSVIQKVINGISTEIATAKARGDNSTLEALEYLGNVIKGENSAVSVADMFESNEFSNDNRNYAVEVYAKSIEKAFKASGVDVSISVYYDNSDGAVRGDWTAKGGKTTITLNGSMLSGEQSAFWVLSHELFHEAESKAPGIAQRALKVFAEMGIYNEKQYEAYRERYQSHENAIAESEGRKPRTLSNEYIESEIAADLMCETMGSTELLEMFAGKLETNDANIILSFLRKMANGIKKAFNSKDAFVNEFDKVIRDFEGAIKGKVDGKDSAEKTADTNTKKALAEIDAERITSNELDTRYSLTHNDDIAKGELEYIRNNKSSITEAELKDAQEVTRAMVDVMMKYSEILPEDKIGKVLTKNGSYDRSVENTTICVRTLAYNEFVDKVQEEIGRPLTQMESFLVSQKLYDIATEPQCLYCYVSLDRKAFNDMLLRYMTERDTVIAKYNNSDKSAESIKKLYEEFLRGRKDTKEMKSRFDKWISAVDNGTQLLSLADIATEERQSDIKAKGGILAEQLADARKYAQSASWSKIQKNYVAYRDEILKLGDRVVKNLNEHYGLRWYSFSDYSAAFIVENMQQITDASIRGLKGLAYTKDTDFVEIFASTGMNINVSVFVNQDANGNFFIDEKQSANFEKAVELRKKYPNVGIVATVTNDEALRWAGEQEWSDVIIPFHIVRTGTDVAEYYKWLNYTSESGDTIADKNLWDAYVDSLNLSSENARKKVSKNIYPSEHKNNKDTYLSLCESRGLSPRFVRFAGEAWYMKLVNETRLSADESSPLKPEYNLDAAKDSFQKFIDKGGYEGGWYKEGVDVEGEVKTVARDVLAGKKANEVEYGRQDGYNPEEIAANRKKNRVHEGDKKYALQGVDKVDNEGDKFTYDALISLPDMEVTKVSDKIPKKEDGKLDRAKVKFDAMNNAFSVGEKANSSLALVENKYTSKKIAVRPSAIGHGLDRRTNVAVVSGKIGELLQNAVSVNEMSSRSNVAYVNKSYPMVAIASDETGAKYAVLLIVNDVEGKIPELVDLSVSEVLYSVNAKKEESAVHSTRGHTSAQNAEYSLTDSNISISEVLSFVKDYFPDVLSNDVLSRFGMAKSGDSKYENVRYALSSFNKEGLTETEIENAKTVIDGLKTRAMASKYLDGYASYTSERMERELKASSSSDVIDYAKSYITWVEPTDFVYATTTSSESRQQLKEEAGTLDLEKLRNQEQPIHLTVDFETGEIVGHEGRHRMLALQKAGVDKVAVVIDALNDDRHHTKPIEFMSLKGQRFGEYRKGTDMYLHDALPLSQRYADVARGLFTTETKSGVRYSLPGNNKLDTEYLEIAKNPEQNKAKLQEIVDEAAIEWGCDVGKNGKPVRFYHGTNNFGFTTIDVAKSDDGISFFATDDLEVARTYVSNSTKVDTEVRKIGKKGEADTTKQGQAEKNEYTKTVNNVSAKRDRMLEFINKKLGEKSQDDVLGISGIIADRIRSIENGETGFSEEIKTHEAFERAYRDFVKRYTEHKHGKAYSWEEHIDTDEGIKLREEWSDYEIGIRADLSTLHSPRGNKGIYEMYGKTDGFLEIDAMGDRWDNIWTADGGKLKTRDVAKLAKEQGYDGIKITNLLDDGGQGHKRQTKPATVYIFLNPAEQMKSADPVTYDDEGNVIPISERFSEKGDIRWALSDNGNMSLEDAWNEKIEKYGAIPKGMNPARDVKVPKRISDNKYVSRTARSAIESGLTPEEFVSEFQKDILDGKFTYERFTDEKAEQKAKELIEYHGFEDALRHWDFIAHSGGAISKENFAFGIELYNQCAQNGDFKNAEKILADISAEATIAGQAIQAMSMLKKMSPDGTLYYLERSIDKINDELVAKFGEKRAKKVKIDEDLANRYFAEKDAAKREELYKELCKDIGEQIPSTFWEKEDAWRYLSMLFNPTTHMRNFAGNILNLIVTKINNTIEGAIQPIFIKQEDRTKTLKWADKKTAEFAKNDWELMKDMLTSGEGKYGNIVSDIDKYRRILRPTKNAGKVTKVVGNALGFAPEMLNKFNSWALEKEDELFLGVSYRSALKKIITARKLDVDNISSEELSKIRELAIKEAKRATFREANALAEAISRTRAKLMKGNLGEKVGGIALGGLFPFTKTPMNITKQSLETSPLGVFKTAYDVVEKSRGKAVSGNDIIADVARTFTGTGLFILGAVLARAGVVSAGDDEDKDKKRFDKLVGEQSYAINFRDGKSYTMDWATPASIPFLVGAQFYKTIEEEGLNFKAFADSIGAITEPVIGLSMLDGLRDFLESDNYSDNGAPTAAIESILSNFILQHFPTLGGKIKRIASPQKKNYYFINKNSETPEFVQELYGSIASKLPFEVGNYQASVDLWGRIENYGGVGERLAENLISPGYYSEDNYTDVDNEILRLYESTGNGDVFPKKMYEDITISGNTYYMNAEQYKDAAVMLGERRFDMLSRLFNDEIVLKNQDTVYSEMTDSEKSSIVMNVYKQALDETKYAMLDVVKGNAESSAEATAIQIVKSKEDEANSINKGNPTGVNGVTYVYWKQKNNFIEQAQKAIADGDKKNAEGFEKDLEKRAEKYDGTLSRGEELIAEMYDKTQNDDLFYTKAESYILQQTSDGIKEKKPMSYHDYSGMMKSMNDASEYVALAVFGNNFDKAKASKIKSSSSNMTKYINAGVTATNAYKRSLANKVRSGEMTQDDADVLYYKELISKIKSEIRADYKEDYFGKTK